MRGTTFAAVVTSTLLAISGCATPGQTASEAATAAPAVTISGLDESTAITCGIANQATLGEDGYDFDVATANELITAGKASKSTLIISAVNVLEHATRNAEASTGEPEEAGRFAEVRTAMLKLQTVCQDVDALTGSIEESRQSLDPNADQGTGR